MSDTVIPTTEERQAEWLDDLHEMVLFMHGHPEAVPAFGHVQATILADDAEDLHDRAVAIGGKWEAHVDHTFFDLTKRFGKHRIVLAVMRDKLVDGQEDFLAASFEPMPSEVVPATDDEVDPF
jgi:hypothetical protein